MFLLRWETSHHQRVYVFLSLLGSHLAADTVAGIFVDVQYMLDLLQNGNG